MKRWLIFFALASCAFAQQPSYQASGGAGTGSCTNQVVTSVNNAAPTCTTVTSAYIDSSVASKSYVDNAVAGINPAVAVQAATTSAADTSGFTYTHVAGIGDFFTGSVNTAVTIDGFTFTAIGQRLLVKNDTQSPSGAFNGIYSLTQLQTSLLAPVLTRALDFDQPSDINNTGAIPVINGTANAATQWVVSSTVNTVGTDPVTFTQFSSNPANIVTQTSNASSGQVCTYTGTNKVCVPATALPNGVTATTQAANDNSTKVATTGYVDAKSSGALVQLCSLNASSSTTLDFTASNCPNGVSSSSYHTYRFEFKSVIPSTTGSTPALSMLMSTDGGTTWDVTHYNVADFLWNAGGSGQGGSGITTFFQLTDNGVVNTASSGGASGWLEVYDPLNGTANTKIAGQFTYFNTTTLEGSVASGAFTLTTAVTAYRFEFTASSAISGNIASGTITLYGITP